MLHFVQHSVHFWHNILPIDKYWHVGPVSQSNVEHSSVLKGRENVAAAISKPHLGAPSRLHNLQDLILSIKWSSSLCMLTHTHTSPVTSITPSLDRPSTEVLNAQWCAVNKHLMGYFESLKSLQQHLMTEAQNSVAFTTLISIILACFRYTTMKLFQ